MGAEVTPIEQPLHPHERRKRLDAIATVVAQDLFVALYNETQWIIETDLPGVVHYCRLEARARLLDADLNAQIAKFGVRGVRPASLIRDVTAADLAASKAATLIGLNSMGRAALMRDQQVANHFGTSNLQALQTIGANARDNRTPR